MKCQMAIGWAVGLAAVLAGAVVWADGNIDPAHAFAWSEDAGWINFAPSNGGATVRASWGLSGYVWAENLGWIHLAATNSTYNNTSAADWGVKLVGKALQGFAWSENAGWVNFAPSNGGVTISNGWFTGYAWGENVGWIHMNGTNYGVRTTLSLGSGTTMLVQ